MGLTEAEKYVARNTMYLHNQIINIHFYSILYGKRSLLVSWDDRNNIITQIFGEWDSEEDNVNDLIEIISNFIEDDDLTSEN